jgi:probable F420-dependent oxidoreductase
VRALARRAEALGYSSLIIGDHVGDAVTLAPLVALTVAAEATERLRVGPLVLSNDLRHPAVLTKELATLDLASSGRLEIGVGAGWLRGDFDQTGIPFDPPELRIARLEEGIAVMKGLMADGPCHFEGRFYRIHGLEGAPKPAQRPHPPLLVAGGGRHILEMAGRRADIVSFNVSMPRGVIEPTIAGTATAARMQRRVEWVRSAAGERFDQIELNTMAIQTIVTEHREDVSRAIAGEIGMDPAEVLASPQFLLGTVHQILDDLVERRQTYGISYVIVSWRVVDAFAPVVEHLC